MDDRLQQLEHARHAVRTRFPMVRAHPDVAGLLRQADLLAALGPALAAPFHGLGIDVVAAPEARGPILGALVARELGAGLALVRKDDRNHPGADLRVSVGPTWRGAMEVFQARSADFSEADRVLAVDDWVTTGSSLDALRQLVTTAGASYVGASVIVRKASDATVERFGVRWLVRFDELVPPVDGTAS